MTTIPPEVKARILRAVASSKYPREALPAVAANHHLTIDDVRDLVAQHGGADQKAMLLVAASDYDGEARSASSTEPDAGGGETRVPVTKIHADPNNVRTELGDLQDLVESFTQVGMLQPIVVRREGGRLIVVAGHRRLAAAQHLGWADVPVVLRPIAAGDVLLAMLHENGQRKDLDPIEEATAFATLKRREELTDLQLAARLGKSQSYVSGRLALLELPEEDQAAIRNGTMSLGLGTQRGRTLGGSHRPGARGKASAAHLSFDHPLSSAAEALCRQLGHSKMTAGRVGGIACGECWEGVIRSDERRTIERDRRRRDQMAAQ